jgi:hypothetical protein
MVTNNLPPPPRVAGISLSGDTPYVIAATENRELCLSIGVEPSIDGSAHPIYFYVATQVGMGMTVAGLCETCEFNIKDGPLLASSEVAFSLPLLTEQPYRVTGQILALTRKLSRKLGVMDLLEYELRLALPNGDAVLRTTNVWVLPRRHLA